MGLFDRARPLFSSPADRRLAAAAAEAWGSVPGPSHALAARAAAQPDPWSGGPYPPPKSPVINWMEDQPEPAPGMYSFRPGYSDHTYTQYAAPLGFEGFSLDAIRGAVAQHRLGVFWLSSLLTVSVLGFAPVQAALSQAIAPILDMPRRLREGDRGARIKGGDRGLSRLLTEEVREQLVPGDGLEPSRYFPPELWGTMAIYLRMMGFAVLQHVDGDMDPETGTRMRFTRIWEPWAINWYRSPRKIIALTTDGIVDIKNDGKFTIVGDTNEPYLYDAAITCLGEEAFGGKLTQEQRLNWLEFFGQPKLYATLPEKVSTHGQAGNAFYAALETIYGPNGRGVMPFGSTLQAVALSGEGSKAFQEGIIDAIVHIFMVLTGSAGTIGNGLNTGAGQSYQPAKGGSWAVRHDLISRPTVAIVRGINGGHIKPQCDQNYSEVIVKAQQNGTWQGYPCMEIPLPDPDSDERIKSVMDRERGLAEQIKLERDVGILVDQDRVDHLASARGLAAPVLAPDAVGGGDIFQYHITEKQVAVDEVRARLGLPPLPDGIGSVEQLARERADGRDKTGTVKQTEEAEAEGARTDADSAEAT